MSGEPRPRLRDRKTWVLLIALGIGLALFSLLTFAPSETVVGQIPAGGGAVSLTIQRRALPLAIASAFSTTVITICLYELLNMMLHYGIWRRLNQHAFDGFFGQGASDRSAEGVVVLQGDRVDTLLEDYVPNFAQIINGRPNGRFFKARAWTNFWDTDGARKIFIKFRDLQLEPPRLRTDERPSGSGLRSSTPGLSTEEAERAPFVFSMGLGYTDDTLTHLRSACDGWLRVGSDAAHGDVIEILHNLVPQEVRQTVTIEDVGQGFTRLLPREWNPEKWRNGDKDVRDYAMILRHTHNGTDGPSGQVHFVLAGFTERSTARAAEFLVHNWHRLWRRYVKTARTGSLGDFLIVIEGPSWGDTTQWREVPHLDVTPGKLRDVAATSVWGQRMQLSE
jgi:hypothetical protein